MFNNKIIKTCNKCKQLGHIKKNCPQIQYQQHQPFQFQQQNQQQVRIQLNQQHLPFQFQQQNQQQARIQSNQQQYRPLTQQQLNQHQQQLHTQHQLNYTTATTQPVPEPEPTEETLGTIAETTECIVLTTLPPVPASSASRPASTVASGSASASSASAAASRPASTVASGSASASAAPDADPEARVDDALTRTLPPVSETIKYLVATSPVSISLVTSTASTASTTIVTPLTATTNNVNSLTATTITRLTTKTPSITSSITTPRTPTTTTTSITPSTASALPASSGNLLVAKNLLAITNKRKQDEAATTTTTEKRAKHSDEKNKYIKLITCEEVFEMPKFNDFKEFEKILIPHEDKGFVKFTLNGDDYSEVFINGNISIQIYKQEKKEINEVIILNNLYQNEIMLTKWIKNYAMEHLDPINHEKLYDDLKNKNEVSYYSFDNEDHDYDFKSNLDFNKLKSPLTLAGINNKGK
jgi:hypothetical protein